MMTDQVVICRYCNYCKIDPSVSGKEQDTTGAVLAHQHLKRFDITSMEQLTNKKFLCRRCYPHLKQNAAQLHMNMRRNRQALIEMERQWHELPEEVKREFDPA